MRNLVWKDITMARWFLVAAIPIYVVQLMSLAGIPPAFALLTLFGAGFFGMVSIGVEESQDTETLWNSLPVSRDQVVYARYATVLLGVGFALAASWGVGASLVALFPREDPGGGPLGAAAYVAIGSFVLLLAAVFLPCYFRFGAGLGAQVFTALAVGGLIVLSVAGALVLLIRGDADALAQLRSPSPEQIEVLTTWLEVRAGWLLGGLAASAVAITTWSSMLSVQFYRARDL
jgi:ABC-type transport system involved in multi-copper enzyme maturation permease subunit